MNINCLKKFKENTKYELWKNLIPDNNNFKVTKHQEYICLDSNNKFKVNQQIFSKNDIIGKGTYGTVQKVFNLNSMEQMACKCFSKLSMNKSIVVDKKFIRKSEIIDKEIFASGILRNENIVNAYEVIDSPGADNIYLIMELCDGDLGAFNNEQLTYDNIRFHGETIFNLFSDNKIKLNEEKIKDTQLQIFKGIMYLHSRNLAHCDLKPQNILVKNNIIKIADFGSLAQVFNDFHHNTDSGEGTEYFEPPEAYMRNYDKHKGDIWSLGVTLFIITYGQLPFEVEIKNQTIYPKNFIIHWNQAVKKQEFSDDLKKFLQHIIEPNQLNRPDIYDLINHPFFIKYDKIEEDSPSWFYCQSKVVNNESKKITNDSEINYKCQISTNHMTSPSCNDHDSSINKGNFKTNNRRTMEAYIKNKSHSFNLDENTNDETQNICTKKSIKNQEYNQQENLTVNEPSPKLKLTNMQPSLVSNGGSISQGISKYSDRFSIKMGRFGNEKSSNFKTDHQTNVISRTVTSKQKIKYISRKSDSNVLSIKELENKQNSKDRLIYDCITQIADLKIDLNLGSDEGSVNSILDYSFDIDDLIDVEQ